jgi:hypothetical protein
MPCKLSGRHSNMQWILAPGGALPHGPNRDVQRAVRCNLRALPPPPSQ